MDLRKEQQNALDELLIKAIKKAPFMRLKVRGDVIFIGRADVEQSETTGDYYIISSDFYIASGNTRINKADQIIIYLGLIDDIEFTFKE
jgi:hypothetical protein